MVEDVSGILKRTKVLLVPIIAGFAFLELVAPVSAESAEEGPLKRNGWTISVVPYLWTLSLDGEVGVKGVEADVDVSFGDILKDLDAAFMLDFIVHKGRFGLFINPLYAR